MLRITVSDNGSEERWTIQGQLTKNSIPELIATWKATPRKSGARIVDLRQVTSIDRSGQSVLSMMKDDGAQFVAIGVYTTYILNSLQAPTRPE
ncbi:MAG: hypothetical protein ROO76_10470 [Terriglobia bacterium]|nr:hypothetical protein [Terriglobia bacterium]